MVWAAARPLFHHVLQEGRDIHKTLSPVQDIQQGLSCSNLPTVHKSANVNTQSTHTHTHTGMSR